MDAHYNFFVSETTFPKHCAHDKKQLFYIFLFISQNYHLVRNISRYIYWALSIAGTFGNEVRKYVATDERCACAQRT